MIMTGADAMVKCLENEGISVVYGYPGVAICPFFNSILDSDIKTVLIRTEQNAAHAASGVARMTGRPGVCAVTSGPGATNVITGIATAFADSIPVICITGQVNSELLGSDVFQEADITGAVESFVKYSYLVKNVNDIPRVFKEAFYIANTGRKGPVLIDIPIDIQNATIKNFHYPEEVNLRTYKPTVKGHAVQIYRAFLYCSLDYSGLCPYSEESGRTFFHYLIIQLVTGNTQLLTSFRNGITDCLCRYFDHVHIIYLLN